MTAREDLPMPPGAPKGSKRVIIHTYEHPVQRYITDNGVIKKIGTPGYLPWVLFGPCWSRVDGHTVVSDGDTIVTLPSSSIILNESL
jgi:hypothetical protein